MEGVLHNALLFSLEILKHVLVAILVQMDSSRIQLKDYAENVIVIVRLALVQMQINVPHAIQVQLLIQELVDASQWDASLAHFWWILHACLAMNLASHAALKTSAPLVLIIFFHNQMELVSHAELISTSHQQAA